MKKAIAILATYYRRAAAAVGKFIGAIAGGEHRTPNVEHRTPNENLAASVPASVNANEIQDNLPLGPRTSGEKNEERNFSSESPRETATDFSRTSSPLPSPPFHGGEGDGFALSEKFSQDSSARTQPPTSNPAEAISRAASPAFELPPHPGSATVPVASLETGERDARAPKQENARGESPPRSAFRIPSSAFDPNFITRDELKRELDSLRRLIESRK